MKALEYDKICYWTEQREDRLLLRNMLTGQLAFPVGCTREGETVQVRLTNGELDSWLREECTEVSGTSTVH